MAQEIFPEIQAATEALESRIAITDGEVSRLKEEIASKRLLLRTWRKALATFNPKRAVIKKRGSAIPRKAANEPTSS